ncbi:MAG: aminotransferase class V-fold PLP-dependent enzyme [Bdellovibrionota bacterium]
MTKDIETFRKEFYLDNPTHVPLNNAGLCLLPKCVVRKVEEISLLVAKDGANCLGEVFKSWDDSKRLLSNLLGALENQIAWTPNCSSSLSFIANGYEYQKGEEIVIFENDYPANFYPWVARSKKLGSTLTVVKAEKDLTRPLDNVIEAITAKTRIVALSHIQSDCGYLMDISAVAEAAHKVGAIVVVDVIQSAGIYPINFQKMKVDVMCGGLHKWLCSPTGAGFLVIKEEIAARVAPVLHGALNYGSFEDAPDVDKAPLEGVRRFEQGTPSFYSVLGAIPALELIAEYSVDKLWKKAQELRALLKNETQELGFVIYGGSLTGPHLSITHSKQALEKISEALNNEKISHALRPAPLPGGKVLRLSPHAYNTEEEIKKAIATLKGALA